MHRRIHTNAILDRKLPESALYVHGVTVLETKSARPAIAQPIPWVLARRRRDGASPAITYEAGHTPSATIKVARLSVVPTYLHDCKSAN